MESEIQPVISSLNHKLKDEQMERYWLSTCVLTHKLQESSLSFQEMYDIVSRKLGHQIAVSFTSHVLTRSDWNTKDLHPFICEDFDFDRGYPEVDLCLAVAHFFDNMRKKDYRSARLTISEVHLESKNVSNFDIVNFVYLLFDWGVISPGDVSKIKSQFHSQVHLNEYEAKFKRLFPNGYKAAQQQSLSVSIGTTCTENDFNVDDPSLIPKNNSEIPDGLPSGVSKPTTCTENSNTGSNTNNQHSVISDGPSKDTYLTPTPITPEQVSIGSPPSPKDAIISLSSPLPPTTKVTPLSRNSPCPASISITTTTTAIAATATTMSVATQPTEPSVKYRLVGENIKYDPKDKLGKGSSGSVFRGFFKDVPAAIKRTEKDTELSHNEKDILVNKCLAHENIVQYYDILTDDDFDYFAIQLCQAGSLKLYVEGNPFDLTIDAKTILKDIVSGIDHLHCHNIIHRDIKPGNILLTKRGVSPFDIKAVLCDFGISRKLKPGMHSATTKYRRGSDFWMSPEMLSEISPDCCTKAVDIFGAGCVMYYLLSKGVHPFGTDVEIPSNIKDYNCDIKDLNVDDWMTAKHLIEMLIAKEPNSRYSAEEALSHCYFWSSDRQALFFEAVCDWIINTASKDSTVIENIEGNIIDVIGTNWMNNLHKSEELCTQKYDETTLAGLLSVIKDMKQKSTSTDFLVHFTKSFPSLLVRLYQKVKLYGTTEQDLCDFYPSFSYVESQTSTESGQVHDGLPYNTGTPPNSIGTLPTNNTGTPPTNNTGTPPTNNTGTPPTNNTGTPPTNNTGILVTPIDDSSFVGAILINNLSGDTLPLIVNVMEDFIYDKHCDLKEIYKMNTDPRGYCVIINIRKDREGTDKDAESLTELFKNLKFEVLVYNDLTKDQILQLAKLIRDTSHGKLSCFVMFILAHGGTVNGESVIKASDDKFINVSEIEKFIKSSNSLIGKPKLLFIQSCRGSGVDHGIAYNEEIDSIENEECDITIATDSDFFIANATTKDHPAARNKVTGAIFIQHLVAIFKQHADKYDILHLMTKINHSVSTREQGKSIITRQVPDSRFTLLKTLYFGIPPSGIIDRVHHDESRDVLNENGHLSTQSITHDGLPSVAGTPPTGAQTTVPNIYQIAKKTPQFNHLFNKLKFLQEKWEIFSVILRVTIEKSNSDEINLGRVLDGWLRKKGSKATWEYIINVLEETLEEQSAADELKKLLQDENIFEEYMNS